MLGNEGKAATITALLAPVSATDTASGTGSYVDVRHYDGDLVFICNVGVVTAGTITPTITHATSSGGAGATNLTLNEGAFTVISTSNDPSVEKRTVDAKATLGYVKFVGTIATGPAQVSATLLGRMRYL
jgi:hypothetical protein